MPDETKISWLSRKVILGQNEGPLLMLGPTRWKRSWHLKYPSTKMPFRYSSIPYYQNTGFKHSYIIQTYIYTIDKNIISAIFCRVVSASMAINTPVTRKGRWYTFSTGAVGIAVEKCEVCTHKLWAFRFSNTELCCKVIWNGKILRWYMRYTIFFVYAISIKIVEVKVK